jgi:hypothetical protein
VTRKQTAFFISVFAILLLGRICIAGTGYLEDQDEFLYMWIHLNFAGFTHLSTWVDCLYHIQGQPPEIAIRLFEYITVLPVASYMGKQMLHPDILYFIGLYNIFASLLILYVFFRILLKLNFSVLLALTGVLLLGTLFNYNMYTRHILPYDHALLFQLLALNVLLRDRLKAGHILLAGLLSAIGLTNYIGGFMFVFINGSFLLFANYKEPRVALRNGFLFVLPFIALTLFYEALARIDGRSYFNFLANYYHTVGTEGSPDEGLVYIFLYFYFVEKWWGLLLLLLFFAGSYLILKRSGLPKARYVIIAATLAYVIFGTYAIFGDRMVFNGRVLHIYYPFVIIGALGWIQLQPWWQANRISAVLMILACINYGFVIIDFNSIGYPRNAIYKYHLFEDKGKTSFTYNEEVPTIVQYSDRRAFCIDSIGPHTLPGGRYTLTNICFIPTIYDSLLRCYKPWHQPAGDSIVFEQLHFESHPAYVMEYCTREGRQFFLDKKFKIRVVKTKP